VTGTSFDAHVQDSFGRPVRRDEMRATSGRHRRLRAD